MDTRINIDNIATICAPFAQTCSALAKEVPGGMHCTIADREAGFPFACMSTGFLAILGWTKEEIETRFHNRYIELLHPDDLEPGMRYDGDSEAGEYGQLPTNVFRVLTKNGYRWVASTARKISYEGKNYVIGDWIDVNAYMENDIALKAEVRRRGEELKAANEELKKTVEEQRSLIEEVKALNAKLEEKQRIIEKHAFEQEVRDVRDLMRAARWTGELGEGRAQTRFWFSDGFRHMLGFENEDDFPNGVSRWKICIHPDDHDRVVDQFYASARDKVPYDVNYRIRNKEGEYLWVRSAAKFRYDKDGVARTCMGVLVDIDDSIKEQMRQQQKLEDALQAADHANKAKTEFLHRMSHDMRTPLNGILGLLQIDEAHDFDIDFIKGNHDKMVSAANHLLSLINDALQTSKLEEGKFQIAHEPVDLLALSKTVSDIIVDRASEAGITIEQSDECKGLEHRYVYGSDLHLQQVFLNIYGNAIKYNKPNGKIITKVDCWEEGEDRAVFRWAISDTGIGMSPEFIEHIFEPFSQEDTSIDVSRGSGLGMSIVKQLVELMDGTIEVRSKQGVGSTFTVTIPFDIAPEPEEQVEEALVDADISGCRVLIAEDNDLNAEIATMFLEDAGATVKLVTDGLQAVEEFFGNPPATFDVILMDIMMPIMDGVAAAKAIRSLERPDAKEIPILAMTANAFQDDVQTCLDAGMNAHLAKPIDIAKVKQAISAAIGRD